MTQKRAAIYSRVSTEEQARGGTSLETQVARCRAHIEAREGWRVADVYEDGGVSGKLANRPELDRLMRDCRSRSVDAIVVTKLDRFGRSLAHLAPTLTELDGLGITFVSLAEQIDSSSITGRAMRGILGVFAEMEREVIVERTVSGLRAVAEQGFWPGGPPPFGLRSVGAGEHRKLELDPDESVVLQVAAKLIVEEGCSFPEAAARLNALDLKPRRAGRWDHQNLRRALKASYLGGTYVYAKQGMPGYNRYGKHGPPVEIPVPSLLDPATFERLHQVINSTANGPREAAQFYPLSGRLFGTCGAPFGGVYRKDRGWRQYRCRNSRNGVADRCDDRVRLHADEIEELVWSEVVKVLSDPERLLELATGYLGKREQQVGVERDQAATLDAKIAKLERAAASALTEGLKAGLDAAAIKLATADLNEELAALRRHRTQVDAWRADAVAEGERVRQLWELAEVAQRRFGTMTPTEKAEIYDLLQVRVHLTRTHPLAFRIEGAVPVEEALAQVRGGADARRVPPVVGPQVPSGTGTRQGSVPFGLSVAVA